MTIFPKPSDRRKFHPQRSFYAQENSLSISNNVYPPLPAFRSAECLG